MKRLVRITTFLYADICELDQKMESLKVIDHANASDRKWLANHIHWAMHNNRRVSIQAEPN